MKIAVSGDCLNVFTSAYPVRGMLFNLIKIRKDDTFVIFYTRRAKLDSLRSFFEKLHALPNVKIQYFKRNRYIVGLQRFLTLSNYFQLDDTYDVFLNPSYLEFIRGFKGVMIANITDLSILHSQATISHARIWKWQNRFAKAFYFRKDTLEIVSISNYTKYDIIKTFNSINANINVIYNGIDDFWFDEKYEDNCITKKYELTNYFIWWGFISRRKNLINLINAYKMALIQNENLPKLLIIGDIAPHMRQSIMPHIDESHIIHLPFQDEYTLKTLVSKSKGLLFPSNYEGFGLPVIEAFSQGVPVACSNVSSLPEISNNKSLLYSPQNIQEICGAILQLAKPIADSHKKVLKNYARQFTYLKAAQAYNDLLDSK